MDIIERSAYALEHFMKDQPEITPKGARDYFSIIPFPNPEAEHTQWDDGDGTSRALDAWMYLREITGDKKTGIDIEEKQREYFLNLINKDNGMVYVADHSYPNRDGYYYHMWDQGRALRHLINRYLSGDISKAEKSKISELINNLIAGCVKLSKTKVLDNGVTARYWETDTFWNDQPVTPDMNFGTSNFIGFTFANSQLLPSVAKWAGLTGEVAFLQLAIELAEGFIAGFEKRRESTTPMFGKKGEWYGHAHCGTSGITGLVDLARQLYYRSDTIACKRYLDIAIKVYGWVFSKDNLNRGATNGWFSENQGFDYSPTSEICVTADMAELAAALAWFHDKIDGYEFLDKLWDDVDRFTINELFTMQILNTGKFKDYVIGEENPEIIKMYDGAWLMGHTYPHDLIQMYEQCSRVGLFQVEGNSEQAFVIVGACCVYSGPRGFYCYWRSMVYDDGKNAEIRFSGRYKNDIFDITEITDGGMNIRISEARSLHIRVPQTADAESLQIFCNDIKVPFRNENGRYVFTAEKNAEYRVVWKDLLWESKEAVGKRNNGHIKDSPLGEQVTFTLSYKGNKLQKIVPDKESLLPYMSGL